ncbi:excinuclease ABC subunit C [candidate division LCP-89 bacterium B3_LCP]|uniref:UvrABC system protein C n=1 Tax=candidate division LCP-89 bacterium B3_LCP TaxID=2012998 RepID=A0A532V0L2_UNCL8|nr:MAG: excinuclease ABC subunit C [candidate division LCP-89 bacterium B3_LCP]
MISCTVSPKVKISTKLKNLPKLPGVYLFRDRSGKVIYVGKAKVLRNRVRSYFNKGDDGRYQYNRLVKAIADLEVIVTDTEIEALILEANLIKKNIPRYNVQLRDDKSYPYLKVTDELFPRVFLTRKTPRDGSKYYGPYTDVKALRQFLRTFKGVLKIRNCNRKITPELIASQKYQPCLNFHINRCASACSDGIASDKYQLNVQHLVNLIYGRDKDLIRELKAQMAEAAEGKHYEEAAQIRDRILQVENFGRLTTMGGIIAADLRDKDVIALALEDEDGCAALFQIRSGRIVGRSHFYLTSVFEKTPSDVLQAFLREYYNRTESLPDAAFLPFEIVDRNLISQWLSERKGRKVHLEVPKVGEKARLVRLVSQNAQLLLGELKIQKSKKDFIHHALKALQRDLHLNKPPRLIEAFDISNIQGRDAVGSMVCFKDAKPYKKEYRRFKIRTVKGADDFAMMGEVVRRRYRRLKNEDLPLPDLVLIDGGKGQLNRAVQVLCDLGVSNIPVIGLAKKLEEVFLHGYSDPQNIPKNSSGLKLICQIRDEAHRFAVDYHRTLRNKRTLTGELDAIPGVGEKRKKALLRHFGSLKKLKSADTQAITEVSGINPKLAQSIHNHLQKKPE